ncbi:MAG TPA: serine/threonine-protein kinase, partial [Planctomycetota bacterium]|nr:serine/threonine-protein kinase [Planctomycetota bacterium]
MSEPWRDDKILGSLGKWAFARDERAAPAPLDETASPREEPAPADASLDEEFGRYLLGARLGSGGSGSVFRAFDRAHGRFVALKVLRATADRKLRERFLREVRTAKSLVHPGIVTIHEAGFHDGHPYCAMELVDGTSAERLVSSTSDARLVARLGAQVARALAFAHGRGIVHRDLKPSNVILERTGRAVLVDFGLAREVLAGDKITTTGTVVGTPAYMSPEQARAHRAGVGPLTDVYGLGATLYHLLTGRAPFTGGVVEILSRIVNEPPPAPSSLRGDLA